MENKNIRPLFHITGSKGWINDPNGLIKYKGLYHVFFQYYPNDVNWGPMHWGHRVSKDLIHWDELPTALYPKTYSGEDGCFSGTSIIHNDTLYLVYTGFYENGGGENIRQVQCLASSKNGLTFDKHGVIIGENDLPDYINPCDFRDPKVWKENDIFYMIVAARKKEGKGHILLFKSEDLFKWEFVNDLLENESKGSMIECPDYVSDLNLLMYSEQFQPNEGSKHLNIHSNRYAIGKIDFEINKFIEEKIDIVDYGFDFYAPQVFANEHILMAWLNMWDRNNPSSEFGFAGQLTVPRYIEIVDNELLQSPVWDYSNQEQTKLENELLDNFKYGALKFNFKDLENFELKLRVKNEQYFKVSLAIDEFVFDRSNMKIQITGAEKDSDSINGIRRMPINNLKDVTIEVIMDEFSLEFFINGKSASFQVYNDLDADGVELNFKASNCEYIKSKYQ